MGIDYSSPHRAGTAGRLRETFGTSPEGPHIKAAGRYQPPGLPFTLAILAQAPNTSLSLPVSR